MTPKQRTGLFIFLALVTLFWRLIPHPPNIALLGALSVTAGYYLKGHYRFSIPLAVAIVSDQIIGTYAWQIMASVYISYVLYSLLGCNRQPRRLSLLFNPIVGAVLGAVLFFLITNAAVWLWSGMYEPTSAGFLLSYINALPFFRNSLLSDIYGTAGIVAIVSVANRLFENYNQQYVTAGQTNTEHV
ncbi:MAG: hypothetical protein Q7S64_02575 [bacterium]|nr:hypothetical protein [bacterium]